MNHDPEQKAVTEAVSRAYYDEFSKGYENRRGKNKPKGYHDMLDFLESDYVRRCGQGQSVLEVGCGTGLVLERIAQFSKKAEGIDLSPGMLKLAQARGLNVQEGSATNLPYEDESFDITCSFKVLAHIPEIEQALGEMARVTKPGGSVIAEFYNPYSLRGLLRKLGPARKIGASHNESDVYTRFDSPQKIKALTPPGCRFEGARGIRIISPAARVVDMPLVGPVVYRAETLLAGSPLKQFAGFYVARYVKN